MPRKIETVTHAPFTEEELLTIKLAQQSFPIFLAKVYPKSFERETFLQADGSWKPFSLGQIHFTWAHIIQRYNRVCILAPRLHLKSTVVHQANAFWRLFRAENDVAGASISYKEELAAAQTEKIKYQIMRNPYCRFWVDRRPTSDSIVDFKISFGADVPWRGKIDPYGVLGNMRSLHPDFCNVDDILSDLTNPLDPKQIIHIGHVFNQVIGSLPRNNGPIDVIGTPQSYEDILYELKTNSQYVWAKFPAIWEDPKTGKKNFLWPEVFDELALQQKLEDIKQRAFDVEYLLTPIMAADTFFPEWAIDAIIDPYLQPADPTIPYIFPEYVEGIYAGMDIGKEVHPTHISIGAKLKSGDLVQIYQEFLDHTTYDKQAAAINQLIKNFSIKRFYYDATRGEMDDRMLSKRALGIKFTRQQRGQMALSLEARVFSNPGQATLVLLPDKRQKKQILSVDKSFKGIETSEGHGDAAFSIALMCRAADDGPILTSIGDATTTFSPGAPRQISYTQLMGR